MSSDPNLFDVPHQNTYATYGVGVPPLIPEHSFPDIGRAKLEAELAVIVLKKSSGKEGQEIATEHLRRAIKWLNPNE